MVVVIKHSNCFQKSLSGKVHLYGKKGCRVKYFHRCQSITGVALVTIEAVEVTTAVPVG